MMYDICGRTIRQFKRDNKRLLLAFEDGSLLRVSCDPYVAFMGDCECISPQFKVEFINPNKITPFERWHLGYIDEDTYNIEQQKFMADQKEADKVAAIEKLKQLEEQCEKIRKELTNIYGTNI